MYLNYFNASLGLNTLKREENYLYFNIFQTRDFNIFDFNIFDFNIFQYVDFNIFYFQHISTNWFQHVSTYLNALFQRYFNWILGLISLNCVEICMNVSTFFFDTRFHWWRTWQWMRASLSPFWLMISGSLIICFRKVSDCTIYVITNF